MKKEPVFIAFCNQKGGVGKTTFSVLTASYLSYVKGLSVAVVDCDFPQCSIVQMRQRDVEQVGRNDYYKRLAYLQFQEGGKRAYPVISTNPEKVSEEVNRLLEKDEREFDVILFDLPGTVNSAGVLSCISMLDYLFVPIIADRVVIESSLHFAVQVKERLISNSTCNLHGLYLFWNKVDKREKTELYEKTNIAIKQLNLERLTSIVPDTKKYNKELSEERNNLFRSTLFAPENRYLNGSGLDHLVEEVCQRINL
jgi:cellulose biosynthesis protein BcsQ